MYVSVAQIAVLIYLLYQKLGVSAVTGAAFCILTMTPLQFLIGKKMSTNSKAITVSVMTNVFKIHMTPSIVCHLIHSGIFIVTVSECLEIPLYKEKNSQIFLKYFFMDFYLRNFIL
jgi:hypothetical protein